MSLASVTWRLYVAAGALILIGLCALIGAAAMRGFCYVSVSWADPASNVQQAAWQVGIFWSRVRLKIADGKGIEIDGSEALLSNPEWRSAAAFLAAGLASSAASLVTHAVIVVSSARSPLVPAVAAEVAFLAGSLVAQIICLACGEVGADRLPAEPHLLSASIVGFVVPPGPRSATATVAERGPAFWLLVSASFAHLAGLLCEIPRAWLLTEQRLAEWRGCHGGGGARAGQMPAVVESGRCYPMRSLATNV